MFAPVVFVHPLRVRRLRPLTIAATMRVVRARRRGGRRGAAAADWVKIGLAALAAYFLLLPLARRPNSRPRR